MAQKRRARSSSLQRAKNLAIVVRLDWTMARISSLGSEKTKAARFRLISRRLQVTTWQWM
jgi:hypothetical protein